MFDPLLGAVSVAGRVTVVVVVVVVVGIVGIVEILCESAVVVVGSSVGGVDIKGCSVEPMGKVGGSGIIVVVVTVVCGVVGSVTLLGCVTTTVVLGVGIIVVIHELVSF